MELIQYYLTNVFNYQMDLMLFYQFYLNKFFVCLIVNYKNLYILIFLYIKLFFIHYVLDQQIF